MLYLERSEAMEPTTILTALIAGASVALKDTAAQAVKDAYSGLKTLLVNKFSISSVATLEKDLTDENFKGSVEKEIVLTPELLNDPEARELIVRLYAAIEENSTPEELRSVGVDIETIRSQRNTVISGVSGFDTGVKLQSIGSGQDTIIEGVTGKSKA